MKFELSTPERHLLADLLRVKAARQIDLAGQRSASAITLELTTEAKSFVELAIRFEDGYEPPTASDRPPATVNATRDLDQLNPPEGT